MAHNKNLGRRRRVLEASISSDPPPDPFGERRPAALQERWQLLGGQFHFETDSPELRCIVKSAYAGLPAHRLSAAAPRFFVRLLLTDEAGAASKSEPPPTRPLAGSGILCGAMHSSNFVVLTPRERAALVVVARNILRFPYHIRYELIEFAVYTLATRVQGLVPLHGACVGSEGRGVLLLGPSGSGKSTLALLCLLEGMDFLAEDSVLVRPRGMRATGIANFLHVRGDSLRFLTRGNRRQLRESPVIRRRSGIEKFEINLRAGQYRLAAEPLRIAALVFLSSKSAGKRPLLGPLRQNEVLAQLAATQRYAAHQPGWRAFGTQAGGLPAFELRRSTHPQDGVDAIRGLL